MAYPLWWKGGKAMNKKLFWMVTLLLQVVLPREPQPVYRADKVIK